MDNRQAVAECLAAAGEIFGKPVSDAGKKLWFRILERHESEAVRRAFATYMTHGEPFMPKPSDIVKLIEGTTSDKALAAWTTAHGAMIHHGSYQSVVFDDALIHAVIAEMGGWQEFCLMTERETPFKAQEFQKRYAAYQHRPPATYPPQLTGRFESENRANGFERAVQPPIAIGDAEKCERVRALGQSRSGNVKRLSDLLPALPKSGGGAA